MEEPVTRSAVFIDGDRTLLRGSALLAMLGPLYRKGYVQFRTLGTSVFLQAIFTWMGFSDAELEAGAKMAAALAKGRSATEMKSMAGDLVPKVVVPRIFSEAWALISHHRRKGRLIFLISSAPCEIVEPLARAIHADGYAGTMADSVDGVYTGAISVFMHGKAKADAIREIAERHNVDLQASYAYSDSGGDEPMLEMVGHPFCVNPDRTLLKIADRRGWPSLRFTSRRGPLSTKRQELRRLTGHVLRRTSPTSSGTLRILG